MLPFSEDMVVPDEFSVQNTYIKVEVNLFRSRSHITTDSQSASPSWCQAPIWDPRPIFHSPGDFLLDSCGLLFCSVLSDERTGLSFVIISL
jgi:hypothetical protein